MDCSSGETHVTSARKSYNDLFGTEMLPASVADGLVVLKESNYTEINHCHPFILFFHSAVLCYLQVPAEVLHPGCGGLS